jgi:hypothetical protein
MIGVRYAQHLEIHAESEPVRGSVFKTSGLGTGASRLCPRPRYPGQSAQLGKDWAWL